MAAPRSRNASRPIDIESLLDELSRLARLGGRIAIEEEQARSHGSHWYRFWRWCEENGFGGETLPISAEALAGWVSVAGEEFTAEEISGSLAAVKAVHVAEGYGAHVEGLGA